MADPGEPDDDVSRSESVADGALRGLLALARTARGLASMLLIFVGVVIVGCFGVLLLISDAGLRWGVIVIGGTMGAVGVGAAALARWRFALVTRHVPELGDEIKQLMADRATSGRQEFIDTFVVDDAGQPVGSQPAPIVFEQRSFRSMGSLKSLRDGLASYGRVTQAITAVTTFPALAMLSIAVAAGFAVFTTLALILAILPL